jgi:alpha-L-glutamate ligase-like protein
MAQTKRRFWVRPRELRRQGVLGINLRNSDYVLATNPRKHYPYLDDKQRTKEICHQRGIPVPQTYALIQRYGDVRRFLELVGQRQQFVIKPTKGAEGRGIVVIAEHDGTEFVTSSGQKTTLPDLRYHVAGILAGLYSLAGQPDRAIVEQRILRHPVFEPVAVGGTPDVRIVLYRCVPVMAMVRLPTVASRGRANLHQGAVAAGIDLSTGATFGGVCRQQAVSVHPDSGNPIGGIIVPGWPKLLAAAIHLAEGLEMGYIGVDFVLDAELGPVVLEANARPGLAIQIANRCGLLPRLKLIDAQPAEMFRPDRRMELVAMLAELSC